MLVLFGLQLVDRSFGPVLPLHLGELGYAPEDVPVVAGILFSILALTAALRQSALEPGVEATFAARGDHLGCRDCGGRAGRVYGVHGASGCWRASLAVVGLCLGTSITTAFAAGGAVIPQDVHATGFGFLTSASLSGVAISPVLSGLVAARQHPGGIRRGCRGLC